MINLAQELKDIKGEPLKYDNEKSWNLGLFIAEVLQSTQIEPLRSWSLARKIYESAEIELTTSDKEFIKSVLLNCKHPTVLTGQALELIA